PPCSPSAARGCSPTARPSGCWGSCLIGCASVACCEGAGASAPTPPTSVWRCVTCTGWSKSSRRSAPRWRPWRGVAPAGFAGLPLREGPRGYGQPGDDWRLPKAEQARLERAIAVGRDGLVLLEGGYAPDTPMGLAEPEGGPGF